MLPAVDAVPRDRGDLGLDGAQTDAVTTPSTLVAVIAGAGSGKTRVLTRRIAHRIATGTADARHTLALTFTREAAGELRRRLRRAGVRDHVEAGTFHAIALALLRQRWADTDRRAPTLLPDRDRLLAEVAGGVPVGLLVTESEWAAARGIVPGGYVGAARAAGRHVPAPERVAGALGAYAELKRRRGVVDFDDLLQGLADELERDRAWADAVRWRFRHVHVDEAQDLNPLQQRVLDLLVGGRGDLFLVGDPAQAIYGFNGADPGLLTSIDERLPGIEVVALPVNHRSTPQIVAAGAAVLLAGGQPRHAVSSRPDGAAVRILPADDEHHEAAAVASIVRALDPAALRTGDVAVLARTNQQLPRLAAELRRVGVPVAVNELARGSAHRVAITAVTRLTSASRLRAWAHDALEPLPDDRVPSDVETAVGGADRDVATAVLDFLREQPLGDGAALRAWLASTRPFDGGGDGVELLTFHAAKGREWATVVVTGVETGSVPHRSATTLAARAEEARLLHVAVTRAREQLVITWTARRGGYRRGPSPLIEHVDTAEPASAPPPADLPRSAPTAGDARLARLADWRDAAARAAMVLPVEICSDADLARAAVADPADATALAESTDLGPLTAARLFPAIRATLDAASPPGRQPPAR